MSDLEHLGMARLIDANAYVDELKWLQEQVSSASAIEIQEYIDRTNRQPTVDAVEVIHGEWRTKILCGGFAEEWGYVCSVCGCTVSDRSKLSFGKFAKGNQKLNYCPNCGADMRGDGNG